MQGTRGISRQTFRAGKFGHDQSAAAQRTNYAAEDRVGDAGHGSEDGRRANSAVANFDFKREHTGYLSDGIAARRRSSGGDCSAGSRRGRYRNSRSDGGTGNRGSERSRLLLRLV